MEIQEIIVRLRRDAEDTINCIGLDSSELKQQWQWQAADKIEELAKRIPNEKLETAE